MRCSIFLFLCMWGLSVSGQVSRKVQYLTQYEVTVQEDTKKIRFLTIIPKHIDQVQQIDTIIYSIPPTRIFDQGGDLFAEFEIDTIKGNFTIEILAQLNLLRNDLSSRKEQASTEDLTRFLLPEKYIESDHELVVQTAQELKKKTDMKSVRNIYSFVHRKMTYSGYNPKGVGALTALQQLHGDCTEFADLFVALCRANQIPARVIEGYKTENISMPKHNWAEVFLPNIGWRIVDPTVSPTERLDNAYIRLSSNRTYENEKDINYWNYTYWGDPIKVKDSFHVIATE